MKPRIAPLASLNLALTLALVVPLLGFPDRARADEPQAAEPSAPVPGPIALFQAFSRARLAASGFERRQAEIEGQTTTWWEKGEGPTLVLVHGVADQAGTWFLVAPALAATRRVLLVDLPGHGESAPASGALPMSTVVGGFESWLAGPAAPDDGEPVTLVGNSMGAWVALLAAHRHPERVARVVAINGGGLDADTGELDLTPADREEARRLVAALRDPGSPATPEPVLDDLVRRVAGGQVERMLESGDDLERHLLDDALAAIRVPVDVVWGESDRYLGQGYAERLLAGLPAARLTLLPRCGHLPQAECPARLLEALASLLAEEPAKASPSTGPRSGDESEAGDAG